MSLSSNIKAGAAYIELYTQDNKLVRGLNRAAKKLEAFGSGIRSIGMAHGRTGDRDGNAYAWGCESICRHG